MFLRSGMTSTGVQIISKPNEKFLPCFTIRPLASYKVRGPHFTSKTYAENSFTLEEIFQNETLKELLNSSFYNIQKHRTIFYGNIFVLCYSVATSIYDNIILKLKKLNCDTDLYIYSKGNEFWFSMPELPLFLKSVQLDSQNKDGVISATALINEIQTKSINKPHSPCKTYTMTEDIGKILFILLFLCLL